MKFIRLGTDINIVWQINRYDSLEDFAGKDITVHLLSKCGCAVPFNFYLEEGKVKGTFYGKDQVECGSYRLELVENEGKEEMVTLDYVDAFCISKTLKNRTTSGQDSTSNLKTESVELTSTIDTNGFIERDPVFRASPAGTITDENINDWNNKVNQEQLADYTPKENFDRLVDIYNEGAHNQNNFNNTVKTGLLDLSKNKADKSEIPDVSKYNPTDNFKSINGESIIGTGNIIIRNKVTSVNGATGDVVIEVPTNVSAFNNDAGYLTEHQDISNLATKDELNSKQDTLVSGNNLATINGYDLLAGGNIEIQGGIEDAPQDGNKYARQNGEWVSLGGDDYITVPITSYDDLVNAMNEYNANEDGLSRRYYYLEADIDCNNNILPGFGTNTNAGVFFGNKCVFDGRLHKISNFKVQGGDNVGLFNNVSDAEIMNLYIENFEITGGAFTGALIGVQQASGGARIHDISIVNGTVTGTAQNASAISGLFMATNSVMQNIYVENVQVSGALESALISGWKNEAISIIRNIAIYNSTVSGIANNEQLYRGNGSVDFIYWNNPQGEQTSNTFNIIIDSDIVNGNLVNNLNSNLSIDDWVQGSQRPEFNPSILKELPAYTAVKANEENRFTENNYFAKDIYEGGEKLSDKYAKKSDIPTVPTNVSAFNNDAGYLTEHQDISNLATKDELNSKQDTLVSGNNLATINGHDLLAGGNIEIQGGGAVTSVNGATGDVVIEVPTDYVNNESFNNFVDNQTVKNQELENKIGYIDSTLLNILGDEV